MARERWRCDESSRDQRDAGQGTRAASRCWKRTRDLFPELTGPQNCKIINLGCFNLPSLIIC